MCSAIRKLAAVATPAEASQRLYRGVRGELPRAFWQEKHGMITAVDTAFTSTSRTRATPIDYMSGMYNVLWVLHPEVQSDAAYHHGADISMLSQFANEQEGVPSSCAPPQDAQRQRCLATSHRAQVPLSTRRRVHRHTWLAPG